MARKKTKSSPTIGPITLVKLGGSLITDKTKPLMAHRDRIDAWAREIAHCTNKLGARLIVGHGSGSFGHAAARSYGLHRDAALDARRLRGIGHTQRAAGTLHALVMDALLSRGARCFSLAPSSFLTAHGGRCSKVHIDPLLQALESGLTPVVYGDVLLDSERTFTIASTEAIFLAITRRLRRASLNVTRALWLGDTEGVYDSDGHLIDEMNAANAKRVLAAALGARRGVMDVTGGMRLRVESAQALARLGVESWILDGARPTVLRRVLRGLAVTGTRVTRTG